MPKILRIGGGRPAEAGNMEEVAGRRNTPLKDLCYLGGWKEPQTVLKCYQSPDEATMREALARRRPLRVGSSR